MTIELYSYPGVLPVTLLRPQAAAAGRALLAPASSPAVEA